jgi:large conductance mechanosensitive channel
VMGAAFTAVINSLVENVIMPIVAIPFGEPNFDSALIITVNDAQIRLGAFLTTFVTFVLTAFVLFLILKAYNKSTGGEAVGADTEISLLRDIRDQMRQGS